jgi:rsbT co-antagonist protein RsbR
MPTLPGVVAAHRDDILTEWVLVQRDPGSRREDRIGGLDLASDAQRFLDLFSPALADDESGEIGGPSWKPVRSLLSDLARTRRAAGFSPAEAARFMFSLKQPMFARLANEFQDDGVGLIASILETTELVDQLGLFMVDEYAKAAG